MGRKRKDCPVFGCTSKNLVRLANHLDQMHNMDTEERTKWLKWSKLGISMPLHIEETTADNMQLQETLERLLQRQEDMEVNFNNYLRTTKVQRVDTKQQWNFKCSTTKRKCLEKFDVTASKKEDVPTTKWLRL